MGGVGAVERHLQRYWRRRGRGGVGEGAVGSGCGNEERRGRGAEGGRRWGEERGRGKGETTPKCPALEGRELGVSAEKLGPGSSPGRTRCWMEDETRRSSFTRISPLLSPALSRDLACLNTPHPPPLRGTLSREGRGEGGVARSCFGFSPCGRGWRRSRRMGFLRFSQESRAPDQVRGGSVVSLKMETRTQRVSSTLNKSSPDLIRGLSCYHPPGAAHSPA